MFEISVYFFYFFGYIYICEKSHIYKNIIYISFESNNFLEFVVFAVLGPYFKVKFKGNSGIVIDLDVDRKIKNKKVLSRTKSGAGAPPPAPTIKSFEILKKIKKYIIWDSIPFLR